MTRIVVLTGGSRGDVQPYMALGKGLQAAGHDVHLLATENYESPVHEAGLRFGSTGPNVQERLESEEWRKALDGGNFLTILKRMRAEMAKESGAMSLRLPPLFEGADLVVGGLAGLGGPATLAAHMGIPYVQALLVPFSPTRAYPSPLAPWLPMGRLLNRGSYVLTRQAFWQMTRDGDAAMRRHLGLPKESTWGPFARLDRAVAPTLYGFSRHVLPRPADWAPTLHVTGYWFLETGDDWKPPADLLSFLEDGPAPVYIGFGSMKGGDAAEAGRIALEALAESGQRGILSAGWGGLTTEKVPESVHLVGSVPHSWLFPKMSAVVHHGGAGTTAAGLRAGAPSILVPFMGDQPFWGRRVAELRVGPAPIPRKRLTVERLAAAITKATSDHAMRRRASELGESIRVEDGVGRAVDLIGAYVAGA